ncbi:hypothetical protein J1N35_041781 [Gossypium stocksii]|uniref:Uncharacterized protein n=1 Tax=Gossypium stocksii TaxID=47602 RepID=A0A9D3UGL2_9ROSI|nr:hypothetical protein J1N35_041781 [Gossypium stocksii]
MTNGVDDQIEPMEIRERARKVSQLRDMLVVLGNHVVNLKESIRDVRETLEGVKGRITELDSMEEKLREFPWESIGSNVEAMQRVLNSTADMLVVREDALKAMMMALK